MRSKYIIPPLIVILGLLALYYLFPSDEKKIKKQFTLLSEWAAKDQEESSFTMAHKAGNIGRLFVERVELEVPEFDLSGSYTREEIVGYTARVRLSFSRLSLQFYDPTIAFLEKGAAKVDLRGRLRGNSTGGEEVDETREIVCVLKKIEDQWLFTHLKVAEVQKNKG